MLLTSNFSFLFQIFFPVIFFVFFFVVVYGIRTRDVHEGRFASLNKESENDVKVIKKEKAMNGREAESVL